MAHSSYLDVRLSNERHRKGHWQRVAVKENGFCRWRVEIPRVEDHPTTAQSDIECSHFLT